MDEGKVSLCGPVDGREAVLGRDEGSGVLDHLQQVRVLLAHRVVPHAVPASFIFIMCNLYHSTELNHRIFSILG